MDKEIMRFHFYRPDKVCERFEKFAREAVPFQAREGFAWEEHPVFITENRIAMRCPVRTIPMQIIMGKG